MTSAQDGSRRCLRVGLLQPIDPASLDPHDSLDLNAWRVMVQVFERPFVSREAGRPVRAELFAGPLEQRGPSYRGQVLPRARFSDGTPVTPQAVASALRGSTVLRGLTEIRAERDAVVFTPHDPALGLERELAKPWASVAKQTESGWVGSGPYMLAEDSTAERTHLVANPHFDGDPPDITEIMFLSYADRGGAAAIRRDLESGDLDFTSALDRDALEGLSGVRKLFSPGSSTAFLWFNTDRVPVQTRRALALGVNRYALAATSHENPGAFEARSPLPPRMGHARDELRYDPVRARLLLEGSPLPRRPLRMITIWGPRPYLPDPGAWAATLANQLGELGAKLDVVPARDPLHYQAEIRSGEYDLVLGGWNADTEETSDFLDALLHSRNVPAADDTRTTGCNFGRWSDPATDAALANYRRNPGRKAEARLIALASAQMPFLALAHGPVIAVHRWELSGFEPDPLGHPRFADVKLRT